MPIALAYIVAHYFSLVVFQGQAVVYLVSDPFGTGSDLFGTANRGVDYSVLSARLVWYVQVAVLVAGHVLALLVAHDRGIVMFRDHRLAMRSQYWMLGIMVAFTSFGLWLLSERTDEHVRASTGSPSFFVSPQSLDSWPPCWSASGGHVGTPRATNERTRRRDERSRTVIAMRTRFEAPIAAEWRGRIAWYWLPAAALVAAILAYGLHHTLLLDGHDVTIVVAVSAALVVVAALLARPAERLLPIVVAAERPHELRMARAEDAGFCAALHKATLEHGFFVALGHGFLRAYYLSFVTSPHALAFVATVDGVPVGMVAGAVRQHAHVRWVLRRRGLRFAARGLAMLVLRPRLAFRFARTRLTRYRGAWRRLRRESPARSGAQNPVAVLSHLAVIPGAQGLGVGVELTFAFLRAAGTPERARSHCTRWPASPAPPGSTSDSAGGLRATS